jgi:hypothetical protein
MKRWLIGAAVVAVAVTVGAAYAAIPGSNGTIDGCYEKATGKLRVVDAEAGKTCKKSEEPIAWSRQGPKGDPGATGPAGPAGPQGPAGPAGTSFGTGAGLELIDLGSFGNVLQLTPGHRLPQGCAAGQVPARAGAGWACGGGGGAAASSHAYVGKGIGAAVGGAGSVVASVTVPAGSYVISGKTTLINFDGDAQDASCRLSTGDVSALRLGGTGEGLEEIGANQMVVTVADAATFGADTTIDMHCSTFAGTSSRAVLTALSVGGVN